MTVSTPGAGIAVGDMVVCRVERPGRPDHGVAGEVFGKVEAVGSGLLMVNGTLHCAERFERANRRMKRQAAVAGQARAQMPRVPTQGEMFCGQ